MLKAQHLSGDNSQPAPGGGEGPGASYDTELLDTLGDAIAECDGFLQGQDWALVGRAISNHFNIVSKGLSGGFEEYEMSGFHAQLVKSFNTASSLEGQAKGFIKLYFDEVRELVERGTANDTMDLCKEWQNPRYQGEGVFF